MFPNEFQTLVEKWYQLGLFIILRIYLKMLNVAVFIALAEFEVLYLPLGDDRKDCDNVHSLKILQTLRSMHTTDVQIPSFRVLGLHGTV